MPCAWPDRGTRKKKKKRRRRRRRRRNPLEEKEEEERKGRRGRREEGKRSRPPKFFSLSNLASQKLRDPPLFLPHLAHHDVKSISFRELLRGELARRGRGDCESVLNVFLGVSRILRDERNRAANSPSPKSIDALLFRACLCHTQPPRPPTPLSLRPRPAPPERHTAILIALERSPKLRDILTGHDEHLFFFRFCGVALSLERVRITWKTEGLAPTRKKEKTFVPSSGFSSPSTRRGIPGGMPQRPGRLSRGWSWAERG